MKHCAGLNVSVKQTAICIVDETGKIVPEATLTTDAGGNHCPVEHCRTFGTLGFGWKQDRCRSGW
jgi:hypothetical protein